MAPARTPRQIRLLTALLLFGTFMVGLVTGGGLCRLLGPPPPPFPPPPPPPFLAPLGELELTPRQQEQARAILERHRPELDALVREAFPRVRAIHEQMMVELRPLLTPAQRTKLDAIQARRPPPPPPGAPPFGPVGPGFPPGGPRFPPPPGMPLPPPGP
jgi:hypothetical protein